MPLIHFASGFLRKKEIPNLEKVYRVTGELGTFFCLLSGAITYLILMPFYVFVDDWFLYSNPIMFAAMMIENLY